MDTKMSKEAVQQEVQILLNDINEHSSSMVRAAEALKQMGRGDVSIMHLDDLRLALATFPSAKKSLDIAKKLVTARIKARLAGE